MPRAPYIDWNQAQVTEPGTTLRVPVVGATHEWCTEFKYEADLRRHTTFQDPWGHIGLIGVVIFVPAITPGTDKEVGLVTMCCGGGLGTGTLIQRV